MKVLRTRNIRYATAERFQAPRPVEDLAEYHDAATPSPACPQLQELYVEQVVGADFSSIHQDEACLNLTVIRPAESASPRPVMVWIHGGSYRMGAGDDPSLDGALLVEEQNVVVVQVTYRLGLLGYLGDPASGRAANAGLLDQVEALRWVQRNISKFGGDPRQVTVFGESAGADAVVHLLALDEAPSLFRRVIIQSAPLGISRGRAKMNEALRAVTSTLSADAPVAEVLAEQPRFLKVGQAFGLVGGMPFAPQYGAAPLPEESGIEAAWNRAAPKVDVMIGSNAEEALFFTPVVPALQRLISVPRLGGFIERQIAAALTRKLYRKDAVAFARRHAKAGGVGVLYEIQWSAPGNRYGSAHAIDLALLFATKQQWERAKYLQGSTWEALQAAGRKVREVWARFARGELTEPSAHIDGLIRYERID